MASRFKSFLLVYQGSDDPSRSEVLKALSDLDRFNPEEVVPGTIHVVGDMGKLQAAIMDLESWKLAPEGRLSDRPPSRMYGS